MGDFNNVLVLDIDDSVGSLKDEQRLDLSDWQESIRFGCSLRSYRNFSNHLNLLLPNDYDTAFLGSGDFHHITLYLLERKLMSLKSQVVLVVLDNHPDNMRFPFGIHCGSWVRYAALHPKVAHVHVVGITSQDIACTHSWENYLLPLYKNKLSYWSTQVNIDWVKRIGLQKNILSFATADELVEFFCHRIMTETAPIYLSIDKDVLSPSVVQTNWDQGVLNKQHMSNIINALPNIWASDVTGDISMYQYKARWKRFLSQADGQNTVWTPQQLAAYKHTQSQMNHYLLELILRKKTSLGSL